MKKKLINIFILLIIYQLNLSAYEVCSQKNPNFSFNDIVYSFHTANSTLEDGYKRFVIFDWHTYEDPAKQNYYWSVNKEDYRDRSEVILWIDNGYFRISYYSNDTSFTNGNSTWDLRDINQYYEFHNTLVNQIRNFINSSENFKKKSGKYYTDAEEQALMYLLALLYDY